ncbi:hypothetical protein BJ170DRAFT_731171 [Xylariales sp. AK1849]|nr:hypothetical protein BJ170DRAFT_731171 [Xylariales sp. AK1849]
MVALNWTKAFLALLALPILNVAAQFKGCHHAKNKVGDHIDQRNLTLRMEICIDKLEEFAETQWGEIECEGFRWWLKSDGIFVNSNQCFKDCKHCLQEGKNGPYKGAKCRSRKRNALCKAGYCDPLDKYKLSCKEIM